MLECQRYTPEGLILHVVDVLAGLRLERRIEEAVPAGQQLQELGMRLRCDDTSSEHVS